MAEESGITISEFYLLNIVLPEGDPTYQRLKVKSICCDSAVSRKKYIM